MAFDLEAFLDEQRTDEEWLRQQQAAQQEPQPNPFLAPPLNYARLPEPAQLNPDEAVSELAPDYGAGSQYQFHPSGLTREQAEKGLEEAPAGSVDVPAEVAKAQGLRAAEPEAEKGITDEELPASAKDVSWQEVVKTQLDPKDYETELSPEKEREFEGWVKQWKPQNSDKDYDLRGAFKAGYIPDQDGNLPDKWAKPNNPYFSKDSVYATGKEADLAGQWDERGQFVPPTEPEMPSYFREMGARAGRGGTGSTIGIMRGAYAVVAGQTSGHVNPYFHSSPEDAAKDIPGLEQDVADATSHLQDMSAREGLTPELRASETYDLQQALFKKQTLLDQAKEASVGRARENALGRISENASREEKVVQKFKEQATKWWEPNITEARNSDFGMQMVESLSANAPTLALSTISAPFALGAMFLQQVDQSKDEFKKQFRAKYGHDPTEDESYAYARTQALVQVPQELIGDVALGGTIGRMFHAAPISALKSKNVFGKWMVDNFEHLAKNIAGETIITTPGQAYAQERISEAYGLTDPMTFMERVKDIAPQMALAGAQSLLMGGAPFLGSAVYHHARGDFAKAQQALDWAKKMGEKAPDNFWSLTPEQQQNVLARAASQAPGLAREGGEALRAAATAVPAYQQGEALRQAAAAAGNIQAAPPAPGVTITPAPGEVPAPPGYSTTPGGIITPETPPAPQVLNAQGQPVTPGAVAGPQTQQQAGVADLLRKAAAQAPDLFQGIAIPPGVETPAAAVAPAPVPVAPAASVPSPAALTQAAKVRLDVINRQMATETDPQKARDLASEKIILEHRINAAHDYAIVKDAATNAEASGAPKTAEALRQTAADDLSTRSNATTDAVDAVDALPPELLAQEPAGETRRGEEAPPPPGGRIIGEPAPAGAPPPAGAVAPEAPAGEEVIVRPGIKGQEVVIQQPGEPIRQNLAGVKVAVEVLNGNGEARTQQQDATQALFDLKKDRTALELLRECIK
jgi:hypothetical protein